MASLQQAGYGTALSQPLLRRLREAGTRERSRAKRDLDPYSYVSCWTEDESINGEDCKALVVILATQGCSWAIRSGCSMCGYTNESASTATEESIWQQYLSALKNLSDQKVLKIYTSGSFLDTFEISTALRRRILEDASSRVERIVIETRHEYITSTTLGHIADFSDRIMLAVGLESANDMVLNYSVNKPSNFSHFVRTSGLANSMGFKIKSYLMLKPPFVSEADAIDDAVRTIQLVSPYSHTVSVNPTNIQKDTVVELLWKRGAYRPPWLWSVVEVLRRSADAGIRVMSKPTGAGTVRGAHNCGRCDKRVLDVIADFSRHQDASALEGLDCRCRNVWHEELKLSNLGSFYTEQDYRLDAGQSGDECAGI